MTRGEGRIPTALKRPLRRVMDGTAHRVEAALHPRLDRIEQQLRTVDARLARPTPPIFPDFPALLHALRLAEVARMPGGMDVVLSAGCSGRPYFDWFSAAYGPVRRHLGVELYLPKPPELPPEVEWIATSVARMAPVPDSSIDLVFSGQNIEHLFGDDLVDFLCEAARVVHPDGWLVIDSPHRVLAGLHGWSMNEHTIELTPEEAAQLVEEAGFRVASLRGLWLTRDPRNGDLLPLDPIESGLGPEEIVRRMVLAAPNPDDSFIWWLEATRTERPPDREALRRRHAEIFRQAWPERANRLVALNGEERDDGRRIAHAPAGWEGWLVIGPYMPLAPAQYTVTFWLRLRSAPPRREAVVASVDVVADGGSDPTIARHDVTAAEVEVGVWSEIRVQFHVDMLRFTGQFRVHSTGVVDLDARLEVSLDDRGSPVRPSLLTSEAL